MTDPPFRRVAIAGLGLIGGSIALAVRRTWPSVRILGVDGETAAMARERGLIDEERAAVDRLQDADLVVLAAPVPQIAALIDDAARAGLTAVITDVGSTKRHVMEAAARTPLTFVGGHPIAGSAQRGIDHARADLFVDQPWVLVGGSRGALADAAIERFVRELGAVSEWMTAEQHDRVMAYVSHLPQLLSSALMRTAGGAVGPRGLAASGRGFADMTRLASSPAELWRGILATNADYVWEAVQALTASLPASVADLQTADRVGALLREANALAGRHQ